MSDRLTLMVRNKDGQVLAQNAGDDCLNLFYPGKYEEGDEIVLLTEDTGIFVRLRLDDATNEAFCYLTEKEFRFVIPFGEKRTSYSPRVFTGEKHLISVRIASECETKAYRNLAENAWDQHVNCGCYPHASANVETRGEAVFAARNAIDGVTENHSHGGWPYTSWGINRQDDAVIKLEFGRTVETDRMVIFTRADFPHDNYWVSGTFRFSDGTSIVMPLVKTDGPQEITFDKKKVEWITLGELIKGDDPSPFPALSQWEVWGTD